MTTSKSISVWYTETQRAKVEQAAVLGGYQYVSTYIRDSSLLYRGGPHGSQNDLSSYPLQHLSSAMAEVEHGQRSTHALLAMLIYMAQEKASSSVIQDLERICEDGKIIPDLFNSTPAVSLILKQFLPKQNPLLALEDKTKQTFQLDDSQPFIVTATLQRPQETWMNQDKIAALRQATAGLSGLEGVQSAISLATVQGAIVSEGTLALGPLLENTKPSSWANQILANALISPALISKDFRTASIVVTFRDIEHDAMVELKSKIQASAQVALPFAHPEVGGTPAVQADVSSLLQSEIRNFVGLGFIACLVVLSIVFANITPVLIAFIITVSANLIILATMALSGYSFTVLSTTIPILSTVTVMSLCIHSMLRLIEETNLNPELMHERQILRTAKLLIGSNFLASLTPTIGFLSLLTTNVPLIRDFGWTVAMAIMISWVVTTLFLVPLLILLPAPRARKWAWAKARWGLYFFRRSGVWALLIIFVSIALAMKGQKLSWTAKLFDDLPIDHQVRTSTETIDRQLGGMIPIDVVIKGTVDTWSDPLRLAQLDQLTRLLRKIPDVGSVVSLTDLLAAGSLTKSRLPASRAATAEALFMFSLADQSPLKNYLNADASRTRLSVRTHDVPSDQLAVLVGKLTTETQRRFPAMEVSTSGMGPTIHHLNNALSQELIFGFWQSMAVIFVLLTF
ncbi:MAG: hypothetical protein EOP06_07595, partial [Proteobacteria bacterium]